MKNPEDITSKAKSPTMEIFTFYFSSNLVYNLLLNFFRLGTQIFGFFETNVWASQILLLEKVLSYNLPKIHPLEVGQLQ